MGELWAAHAREWPAGEPRAPLYDALLAEQLRCPSQWDAATRTVRRMKAEGVELEPRALRRLFAECAHTGARVCSSFRRDDNPHVQETAYS
eukprot:714424-Pyramimonas_sp.AAC.1